MAENSNDPWGTSVANCEVETQGFNDNFADKLPDHEEYLNKLESKLDRIKKKSSIAKELAARRSDEARRMLESSAAQVEFFQEEEIGENSVISRRLFPEKQALNMSEIAKLLESDVLAKNATSEDEEKEAKEVDKKPE